MALEQLTAAKVAQIHQIERSNNLDHFNAAEKSDLIFSLALVFAATTYTCRPRESKYPNILGAWVVFLSVEAFASVILFLLFYSGALPVILTWGVDGIYWIVIGVSYAVLVRAATSAILGRGKRPSPGGD
jgi:hypothetical protein